MNRNEAKQESQIARAIETAIRLGAIFVLGMFVFDIVRPFVSPVLWGVIIAVAAYPGYVRLVRLCGGRTTLAAVVFALLALALLITPTVMLTDVLVEKARTVALRVDDGTLEIPRPPAGVEKWPLVGPTLHQRGTQAASDLETALRTPGPQLATATKWLLDAAASAGKGVLQFVLSILIAAGVLANAEGGSRFANRLFVRLAPGSGAGFARLAEQTVRSVATGVIGVAIIQSVLVAVGVFAIGAPAAPVIVLACLLLGVVQLPTLIVLLPVIVWAWSATEPVPAAIFTIWSLAAGLSDNVLKPILLGRGVEAPMLVIFLGAIGGFVTAGIIGLFVGAVILVLAYELFNVWLSEETESDPAAPEPAA